MRPTYTCQQCGRPFHSTNPNPKYCSRACQFAKGQARIDRICAHCGVLYHPLRVEADRSKFCSILCQRRHKRNRLTKSCVKCGATFTTPAAANAKFCSLACAGINRGVKVDWECEACGRREQRPPYRAKERFCSVACRGKGRHKRSERTCAHCGQSFTVQAYRADAVYCCRACMDAAIMCRVDKRCAHCGKEWITNRLGDPSIYCSRRCYRLAKDRRVTLSCAACRKEFRVIPARAETAMFCSRRCRYRYGGETIPEKRVRMALGVLGSDFLSQHPVKGAGGRHYFLDFYLPALNIALEVDGVYWHADRADHDAKRDAILSSKGIRTIRVTDIDIMAATCLPSLIASRLGIKWQGQLSLSL